MSTFIRAIRGVLLLLGLLFLVLISPSLIRTGAEGLILEFSRAASELSRFGADVAAGKFFISYLGETPRSLLFLLPTAWFYSFFYLFLAAAVSLVFGLLLGFLIAWKRRSGVMSLLGIVGAIPDFVLALILMSGAVTVYQATGIRVARIGNISSLHLMPPLMIPLSTMIVLCSAYLTRVVRARTLEILGSPYILFARSKGLSSRRLAVVHILPGLLVTLEGHLYRLLALIMGSLFILEAYFNIPGLTRLLFRFGFSILRNTGTTGFFYQAQFGLSLFCLIGLVTAFLAGRLLLGGLLRFIRWGITHG